MCHLFRLRAFADDMFRYSSVPVVVLHNATRTMEGVCNSSIYLHTVRSAAHSEVYPLAIQVLPPCECCCRVGSPAGVNEDLSASMYRGLA